MNQKSPNVSCAVQVSRGKCVFRWCMIRVINMLDWWLYTTASTNWRGRLEIWAYHRGWVDLWPGRKEAIEFSIKRRKEIEAWRNGGWRLDIIKHENRTE
jgi:hypothetical protein